jgi:hypothetical protein
MVSVRQGIDGFYPQGFERERQRENRGDAFYGVCSHEMWRGRGKQWEFDGFFLMFMGMDSL